MATGLIPHPRALSDGFAAELAAVLGSRLAAEAAVTASLERPDPAWVVEARLDGAATGVLTLGLGAADAEAIARLLAEGDASADAGDVAQALRALCVEVVQAFARQPLTSGLQLVAGDSRPGAQGVAGEVVSYRLALTPEFSPLVTVWSRVERAAEAGTTAEATTPEATAAGRRADRNHPANLDVILDIDLPLSVRFGESEMALEALTKLGPGSVIDLRRSPDDPVDVLVNGRLVARGEVVVVAGNYGVRILEVVSAADRMRTMRA